MTALLSVESFPRTIYPVWNRPATITVVAAIPERYSPIWPRHQTVEIHVSNHYHSVRHHVGLDLRVAEALQTDRSGLYEWFALDLVSGAREELLATRGDTADRRIQQQFLSD